MKALSAWCSTIALCCGATMLLIAGPALAEPPTDRVAHEEAQWIWSPAQEKGHEPEGNCFFRKTFHLTTSVEQAQIEITADDAYELYVNGRRLGEGHNWRQLDTYDIARYLVRGANTIAVQAANTSKGSAGMVARVLVKQVGGTQVAHSTDATWRTHLKEAPKWTQTTFNDGDWVKANSLGKLWDTLPWGNEVQLAGRQERFHVLPEFRVEWVIAPKDTGSLIAMTFNEFGQIVASREGGGLLLVTDANRDGVHDQVSPYCDEVKNCQGLLALNGRVYATGDGPDGPALYLLSDNDHNSQIDSVETLVRFEGPMGEHGAHGVELGPDGMIYVVVGNHAHIADPAESSPYRDAYEGELLTPRYEDPGGHAVGIRAPGGTVIRTDPAGKNVEVFAGGLRNAYDLAFNRQGDLFIHDSDMEANLATPWYRPTRLNHVIAGAELGWRSGWAKFADYWFDGLPATLNTGPGSPTGLVCYNHYRYPVRFHNALFTCDWAQGRINVLRMEPRGASYAVRLDPFLQGTPLNVTDIAVGPDGWLYFCTGGRDTEGGIYCVTWNGVVPPEVSDMGRGIERALRQPQLQSAWARQKVAGFKQEMGDEWDRELTEAARSPHRTAAERTRALELMQLFGPFPTAALLAELTADALPEVRAKAAYLCGVHGGASVAGKLEPLLRDRDPAVRRQACEALVRAGREAPLADLLTLLGDGDREVSFAARRALERIPSSKWRTSVLKEKRVRVLLVGSLALLTVEPNQANALSVLDRSGGLIRGEVHQPDAPPGFINDQDFTDLLRLIEVALIQGQISHEHMPELCAALNREYPSRDAVINRELVRLLAYLQQGSATERMIEQLKAEIPQVEKLHIAACAPFLKEGWSSQAKLELLRFYEGAHQTKGGSSFARYVDNLARDFSVNFTADERRLVLDGGTRWPRSALAVLTRLPADPGGETVQQLTTLDRKLHSMQGEAVDRLRMGIVAVLARSGRPDAMAHLRRVFDEEPARRETVAMGLAQSPGGENWPLLVRALPILEGVAAMEVVGKLQTTEETPDDPKAIRQAILLGLRLKEQGAGQVIGLLEHWTGEEVGAADDNWDDALRAWQQWFVDNYPDQPEPVLPVEPKTSKWTYQELVSFLASPDGSSGDIQRGALVFEQAQCSKCHRFGGRGESTGPDLTTVSRRFQTKEILQATLFPSHVISDQYASKKVLTKDGHTLVGLVGQASPEEIIVLLQTGEKVIVSRDQIDELAPSKISAMPTGLLDRLTLEEIADLFAYLGQSPRDNITSRRAPATSR